MKNKIIKILLIIILDSIFTVLLINNIGRSWIFKLININNEIYVFIASVVIAIFAIYLDVNDFFIRKNYIKIKSRLKHSIESQPNFFMKPLIHFLYLKYDLSPYYIFLLLCIIGVFLPCHT